MVDNDCMLSFISRLKRHYDECGEKALQSCLICFWMKKPNFYFMRQYVRATFSSTVNLTRKHTAADISSQVKK